MISKSDFSSPFYLDGKFKNDLRLIASSGAVIRTDMLNYGQFSKMNIDSLYKFFAFSIRSNLFEDKKPNFMLHLFLFFTRLKLRLPYQNIYIKRFDDFLFIAFEPVRIHVQSYSCKYAYVNLDRNVSILLDIWAMPFTNPYVDYKFWTMGMNQIVTTYLGSSIIRELKFQNSCCSFLRKDSNDFMCVQQNLPMDKSIRDGYGLGIYTQRTYPMDISNIFNCRIIP